MRRAAIVVLLTLATLGCSKSGPTAKTQVRECSSISLDASGTARCLVQLYGWDATRARAAALARHRELDSLKTWQEDSLWRLDGAKHRQELQQCLRGVDPLDRCLLVTGWPEGRIRRASDSIWAAHAAEHRSEVQACEGRRDVALASCLMLYYRWDSDRALRTADSITRARLTQRR